MKNDKIKKVEGLRRDKVGMAGRAVGRWNIGIWVVKGGWRSTSKGWADIEWLNGIFERGCVTLDKIVEVKGWSE